MRNSNSRGAHGKRATLPICQIHLKWQSRWRDVWGTSIPQASESDLVGLARETDLGGVIHFWRHRREINPNDGSMSHSHSPRRVDC